MTTITIGDFKSHLSEMLGRVSFKKETILITRHGRVVARLSPPEIPFRHLSRVKGWLKNDDPFFGHLSDIVKSRSKHFPRVVQ